MTRSVDHHFFPRIDSTNSWSKQQIAHFNPAHITVVTAGEQTAGRGRHDRQWISPSSGNFTATYTFFLPSTRKDIANAAQAVITQVAKKLHAELKWPNDLLIHGKKMGGVLGETTVSGDLVAVIIGLGVNVNMPQDKLNALKNKATSLAAEAGHSLDIETITEQIHEEVCKALNIFIDKGFDPFIHDFRSRLVHHLGDTIEFHIGNQVLQGTFHSINDDGTLNLILDGSMRTFASGEMLA